MREEVSCEGGFARWRGTQRGLARGCGDGRHRCQYGGMGVGRGKGRGREKGKRQTLLPHGVGHDLFSCGRSVSSCPPTRLSSSFLLLLFLCGGERRFAVRLGGGRPRGGHRGNLHRCYPIHRRQHKRCPMRGQPRNRTHHTPTTMHPKRKLHRGQSSSSLFLLLLLAFTFPRRPSTSLSAATGFAMAVLVLPLVSLPLSIPAWVRREGKGRRRGRKGNRRHFPTRTRGKKR